MPPDHGAVEPAGSGARTTPDPGAAATRHGDPPAPTAAAESRHGDAPAPTGAAATRHGDPPAPTAAAEPRHGDAPAPTAAAEPAGWSGPRPLLAPHALIALLTAEVHRVREGRGRVVFLLGEAGVGKTRALEMFEEHLHRQHIAGLRIGSIDCAYTDAWREIARIFTFRHRLRGSALRLLPEWLGAVPVLGEVFTAIAETVRALRRGRGEAQRPVSDEAAAASAMREVRALLEIEPLEPRVILLDSLDRASADELTGAFALIQRIADTRTLLVLAARTTHGAPDAAARELILEAERGGRARTAVVEPLARAAVAELVLEATRDPPPAAWIDWLLAGSDGVPALLWQRLGVAERNGGLRRAGRGWMWYGMPPADAPAAGAAAANAVPDALARLDAGDRRILAIAALEGRVFHSAAVAAAGALDELHVEDRLAALQRAGLVERRPLAGAAAELTSRFAFRSEPLRRAAAAGIDPEERAALEAALAAAVEDLALPATD